MTQPCEPHDGLRGKFLRQFHAALVSRAVGIVEIDVGQLFCAAQRTAFDLFDLLKFRAGVISIGRCQKRRGQGSWIEGQELLALGRVQPLRPGHHVSEEKTFQQRRRASFVDSLVILRCILAVDLSFGAPGKPPLAAQQIAVG